MSQSRTAAPWKACAMATRPGRVLFALASVAHSWSLPVRRFDIFDCRLFWVRLRRAMFKWIKLLASHRVFLSLFSWYLPGEIWRVAGKATQDWICREAMNMFFSCWNLQNQFEMFECVCNALGRFCFASSKSWSNTQTVARPYRTSKTRKGWKRMEKVLTLVGMNMYREEEWVMCLRILFQQDFVPIDTGWKRCDHWAGLPLKCCAHDLRSCMCILKVSANLYWCCSCGCPHWAGAPLATSCWEVCCILLYSMMFQYVPCQRNSLQISVSWGSWGGFGWAAQPTGQHGDCDQEKLHAGGHAGACSHVVWYVSLGSSGWRVCRACQCSGNPKGVGFVIQEWVQKALCSNVGKHTLTKSQALTFCFWLQNGCHTWSYDVYNIKKFGRVDLDCHQWTKPAKLIATLRCSGLCLNLAWIKTPKEMPLHIYTFSVAMSSPVANSALMMLQQVSEIKMTYLNAFRATNGPRWKLKASRPDEKSSQRIRNTFRKRHLQIFQHSTAHKSKDFKRIHHHFPSDFPICRRTPCRLRACEVWNGKRSPS